MTDTIEPLGEDDTTGMLEEDLNANDDNLEDSRQDIFAEQFQALMGGFGETCETQNIEIAIAIAKHPDRDEPLVFYRGHIVDAAALAANVLRQIKQQLFDDLRTEPK